MVRVVAALNVVVPPVLFVVGASYDVFVDWWSERVVIGSKVANTVSRLR